MNKKPGLSIKRLVECGSKIADPRRQAGNYKHKLVDMLAMTILAMMCGCETWDEIADYCAGKKEWLQSLLGFRHNTPSEATFRRMYTRLAPGNLESMYREWVRPYVNGCRKKHIGIDGKTVRGVATGSGEWSNLHVLSAWVREDGISLGQINLDEKENEIVAIPRLLDVEHIAGGTVAIDAMDCQTAIAEKIISRGAGYLLAVKGNQPNLLKEMTDYFEWAQTDEVEKKQLSIYDDTEWSHVLYYHRKTVATSEIHWFESRKQWRELRSFIMIEQKRIEQKGTSFERRYYISSLDTSGKAFAQYIRGHWSIENNLHWMLDVQFHEDKSLICTGHAPENISILRKIALSLLIHDTSRRISIRRKQRLLSYDGNYALDLFSGF